MQRSVKKQFRAAALRRLYELHDRKQQDITKVNDYVRLLQKHGLTTVERT